MCGQGSGCRLRRGGDPLLAPPQLRAGLARVELLVGPPGPCCLEPGLALVTPGLLCSHSPWEPPNACAGGRGRPGGAGADPGGRSHLLQGPEPSPKEVGELCSGLAGRQRVHGQSPAGAVGGRGDPMLVAPPWAPAFCRGSRLGCGDALVTRKLREGSTGPPPGHCALEPTVWGPRPVLAAAGHACPWPPSAPAPGLARPQSSPCVAVARTPPGAAAAEPSGAGPGSPRPGASVPWAES